jgi:hypothetical protein
MLNRLKYYCQQQGINVTVKNSKYDSDAREDHFYYDSTLLPVVIDDDGKVKKLKEWKP